MWGRAYEGDNDFHLFQDGRAICDRKLRQDPDEPDPTRFENGHIPTYDEAFCSVCLKQHSKNLMARLPEDKRQFAETCRHGCDSGHILGDCIHISECFRDSLAEAGYLMKEYGAEVRQVDDYATVCPRARQRERRDRYEVVKV